MMKLRKHNLGGILITVGLLASSSIGNLSSKMSIIKLSALRMKMEKSIHKKVRRKSTIMF
jgi:hypothetical protein